MFFRGNLIDKTIFISKDYTEIIYIEIFFNLNDFEKKAIAIGVIGKKVKRYYFVYFYKSIKVYKIISILIIST